MGKKRREFKVLVGKSEEKRPLGSHRCRRNNDIEMDLK
jgi:hypothetical protein